MFIVLGAVVTELRGRVAVRITLTLMSSRRSSVDITVTITLTLTLTVITATIIIIIIIIHRYYLIYTYISSLINAGKAFGANPPSRSCVSIPLPRGVAVAADVMFLQGSMFNMTNNPINTLQRKVLHVQSVSTWAPLCIGPYSQAQTIYDSLIFVSGQIALNPGSMLLIDSPSFHLQVDQCLRNISRLLVPLYSNLLHMFNLVVYVDVNKVLLSEWSIIQITRRAFKLQIINHMHVMDLDAYDELCLPQYVFGKDSQKEGEEEEEEEEDEKQEREDLKLKHLARINKLVNNLPISVIKVNAIPKESLVELEAVCIKAKKGWCDDDDFLDDDVCTYGHMQFNTFPYSAKELKKILHESLSLLTYPS